MRLRLLFLILLLLSAPSLLRAQAPRRYDAAEIQQALQQLNVLGTVLYVAAHPDDENTRLISWLANDRHLNTGYLSITRGDGGQNLIGPEIRERLGIIRTQELLQARRVDGGMQFFTRANDFGFSKIPDETFRIWDREQVLADMVWTIRKFRPDVMITRFTPENPGSTHGHHTASAILAIEAFEAAADLKRFPEQLKWVEVWQPKRIVWNTSSFFFQNNKDFDTKGLLTLDVGTYNQLLGKSYPELAAESRSMHKSQGFGSSGSRGSTKEYFKPLKGPEAKTDLMEGVDLSWNRVKGGEAVGKLLSKAAADFNPVNPAASVPLLLKARQALQALPDSYYKRLKLEELDQVLKACLGLYLEATAGEFATTPGEQVKLTVEATNRAAVPVQLQKVTYTLGGKDTTLNATLQPNTPLVLNTRLQIPAGTPVSQPYWLRQEGTLGMFAVAEQQLVGLPENPPAGQVQFDLTVQGQPLRYTVPVVYKRTDPVEGESYRPFEITPPVLVVLAEKAYTFADDKPKTVRVMLTAGKPNVSGTLTLEVPQGWRTEPASVPFTLKQKGEDQTVSFGLYPPAGSSDGKVKAVATVDGKSYDQSLVNIVYSHIPNQTLYPKADARIVSFDIEKRGDRIAYLAGAGDEVPQSLRELGYQVTVLRDDQLTLENLQRYDALVLGVRAYNTVDRLKFIQPRLMEYVQQGGTMLVQYNTTGELVTDQLGPYPFKLSRERVTVEEAPVQFLKPEHPVLNVPNKITEQDFSGWVQERGLYFPSEWSKEYEALLRMSDPGEPARDGSLLVAPYGKGWYVYTGLSFFRQLPAGVPGAYRLFANLLSLGKESAAPAAPAAPAPALKNGRQKKQANP